MVQKFHKQSPLGNTDLHAKRRLGFHSVAKRPHVCAKFSVGIPLFGTGKKLECVYALGNTGLHAGLVAKNAWRDRTMGTVPKFQSP